MTHQQIIYLLLLMLVTAVDLNETNGSSLQFEQLSLKTHPLKQQYNRPPVDNRHDGGDVKTFKVSAGLHSHSRDKTTTKLSATSSHRGRRPNVIRRNGSTQDRHSFSETSQSLIKSLCNMSGKTRICYSHGESVCRCKGQLADCSGQRYVPNIHYAPKLPKEIKCLIFRYNNAAFLDDSYFANVSDFRVVDFSNNRLRKVSTKTFARFNGSLKYLILNSNSLSYSNIRNVLSHPPSIRLDLVNAGISQPIPKDYFQPFANILMQQLYLDLNYLHYLDLHELSVLKNLKFLSVTNCSIGKIMSDFMPSLEFLNLDNNPVSIFPETCRKESINVQTLPKTNTIQNASTVSMFSKLNVLLLGNNNIKIFPYHTDLCLPKLQSLNMYLSNISTFHADSLKSLSSLGVLTLDRMKTNVTKIENNAFSSKTLKSLHLTKNHIMFGSENVSDLMFQDCPLLEVLHLDHNSFLNVSESSYDNLFSNLSELTSLYLGSSQMTFIPAKAFAHLTKVIRLYLYINKISSVPPSAFDAMLSLEYLYLDQNQIHTISQNAFSSKTIQRLKEVDMNRNDFQCNCDLLWFQSWLKQDGPTKFYDFPKGYTCANRPGTMVSEYFLSEQACLYSRKTYILFTVCLSILIVCFVVFAVGYRYRWHIRLAVYQWSSTRPSSISTTEVQDHGDETHDVFIVYCNDDSSWVLDELLHRVEAVDDFGGITGGGIARYECSSIVWIPLKNEWGLQAFVHERDFKAGHWIMDNIVMAMNSCRHILVVLSPRFAQSQWCNMELMLCQSHVIEHDLPSLLVVELEPMEPRQMSPVIRALRSSTTFLEWPRDPRIDAMFWRKLEQCVRAMASSNRRLRGQPSH